MAKSSLGKELEDLYVESQGASRAYRDICSMNIITPDANDLKYMGGLRSAVLKHMERNISNGRKDEYYSAEDERFYRYVESIMTSPSIGEWQFIKEDVPNYPFSSVYGVVFVFEYEGDTTYYGWDADREEIGFYSLPKHLELNRKEFILMEDILNEPLGISEI